MPWLRAKASSVCMGGVPETVSTDVGKVTNHNCQAYPIARTVDKPDGKTKKMQKNNMIIPRRNGHVKIPHTRHVCSMST